MLVKPNPKMVIVVIIIVTVVIVAVADLDICHPQGVVENAAPVSAAVSMPSLLSTGLSIKKCGTFILPISLPTIDRFSKFFHCTLCRLLQ